MFRVCALVFLLFFSFDLALAGATAEESGGGILAFSSETTEEIKTVVFRGAPLRAHSECQFAFLRSELLLECSYKISSLDMKGRYSASSEWDKTKYENGEGSPLQDLKIENNLLLLYFSPGFSKEEGEETFDLLQAVQKINESLEKSEFSITLTYEGDRFDSFDTSVLFQESPWAVKKR